MTCIVGVNHNGQVWMGGDSAGVDNRYGIETRADEKVFSIGPVILGFTSSFRMGQLLRFKLVVPPNVRQTDLEYMCTDFVDCVRDCLTEGGFAQNKSGEETGGTFMVGYNGNLYVIQDDYQVAVPERGYSAVGCGDHIALGSLYSTEGKAPRARIIAALRAAEEFSAGVRAPFIVASTAKPKEVK